MYLPVTNISSVEERLGVVNDKGGGPPPVQCPHYDADHMLHGEPDFNGCFWFPLATSLDPERQTRMLETALDVSGGNI
jgi:hypothetical protein